LFNVLLPVGVQILPVVQQSLCDVQSTKSSSGSWPKVPLKSHSVRAQNVPDVQSLGTHRERELPASSRQLFPGGDRIGPPLTLSPIQIGNEFWLRSVRLVVLQVGPASGIPCAFCAVAGPLKDITAQIRIAISAANPINLYFALMSRICPPRIVQQLEIPLSLRKTWLDITIGRNLLHIIIRRSNRLG
jgi:hypothetical protein